MLSRMLRDRHDKSLLLALAGFLACLFLAAAIYWPGLSGPFMLDDNPNIVAVMPDEKSWESFVYLAAHNGSGISSLMGRAVSVLSFFLTALEYDLDPWGYKYHNLLLHLLNGVLLFRFLQTVLPRLDRSLDEQRTLLIAGTTAVLWLLHPLLVSTVLYAVQRMTQLAVCFTLLALLAYMKARAADADRFRFYLFGWIVMPLMALLSLMSKELGALLPLYFLVLEMFAFRTTLAELRSNRRLASYIAVFIVVPLAAGAVILATHFDALTNYSERSFTLGERVLTQVHVLAFYLRLILLPRIRDMSLFHDDFPVTTALDGTTLLLLTLLLATMAAAWRLRKTWPVVSFVVAWFVVSHLLESTIIPLEMVFEHRNYFGVAAVLLLPVWAVFRVLPLKPLWPLLPLLAAMYAFMTTTRAAEWGDYDLFYRVAVEEHPRSARALNGYINYLMQARALDEAERRLVQLRELEPTESGTPLHQQVLGCAMQKRDPAALESAEQLLANSPVSVYANNALQTLVMLVVEKKCSVVTSADLQPLLASALRSENIQDRGRGYLLRLRGIVGLAEGRYAQGYSDFREAHLLTGDVSLLTDLLRYQTIYDRLGDAEETLALIEQENAKRLGIEQYEVNRAKDMLEKARRRWAELQTATPADTPTVQR